MRSIKGMQGVGAPNLLHSLGCGRGVDTAVPVRGMVSDAVSSPHLCQTGPQCFSGVDLPRGSEREGASPRVVGCRSVTLTNKDRQGKEPVCTDDGGYLAVAISDPNSFKLLGRGPSCVVRLTAVSWSDGLSPTDKLSCL